LTAQVGALRDLLPIFAISFTQGRCSSGKPSPSPFPAHSCAYGTEHSRV